KILAALVSVKNKVVAREYQPTLADGGQRAVIDRIFETIDRLLSKRGIKASQLEAIGIAAAGAIDSAKGLVTSSPHLPDWCDVALKQIVARRYQVDAFIINDASAAALGEHRLGAGRGVGNLVYLTVSTGIGGGIIINGRLYLGSSGSAGELGHLTIDVNGRRDKCGNIGCLELLASGTAIAEEARRRLKEGQTSALKQIAAGGIESITAEDVAAAAQSGDLLSREVIHQAAHYLGVGMVNIVNIFNPDMIIVGGGVAKMGELLLEPARQVVLKRAFELPARAVRIVTAQLGDDAGVLGAALFAREQKVGAV
ncbi:MAG: ROK family protein, partial [Dehalococcoidales bacterium]